MSVLGTDPHYYARWRAQNAERLLLGERDASCPKENLLQGLWLHQRFLRGKMQTAQGQSLRVLHPGFWNHESGPDFRGAVIQFGDEPPRSGDVEIDLVPGNWRSHGHEGNPAFAKVILHVVWAAGQSTASAAPLMALENLLDSPLEELQTWAGTAAAKVWPETLQGACSAPLSELSAAQITGLLQQAALVRFESKARALEARARQSGWEQSLWEGLFQGLGYKQNTWPMQRLGELLPLFGGRLESPVAWQARLLGVAGLLPADLSGTATSPYLRQLWDHWWREREQFAEVALPRSLWRFNGLRPANQPQRRLALAAHWLAAGDFPGRLERWFKHEETGATAPASLLACLQPAQDEFWAWRWGLNTPPLRRPQPLLGASRATDLAVNVILPWFWARARAGRNEALQKIAVERFLAWPEAQDNALLRLARRRLLGRGAAARIKSAAGQQGLLQIVRDFCDHSNAVCTDCAFPALVRGCAAGERSLTEGAAKH